jgi:uncharacterized oligopeptide transporter (OPT) family protein
VQLLILCFAVSGFFTLSTYFFPILRDLPIFGSIAATTWLWTLNPSLAYVGQGIIMGPVTTLHMLLGAVVGWAILSPLAKYNGWAPGPTDNWETGSKGWIVWTSLAIMLADAIVSLGYLALRPVIPRLLEGRSGLASLLASFLPSRSRGYTSISAVDNDLDQPSQPVPASPLSDFGPMSSRVSDAEQDASEDADADAPAHQQISNRVVVIGLLLSVMFCIFCTHVVFGDLVPLYANLAAVLMALVLSIMGVRALGETDLNPVSGISKLAQLFFALIIPQSNKASVLINLVAGAVVSNSSILDAMMYTATLTTIFATFTSLKL